MTRMTIAEISSLECGQCDCLNRVGCILFNSELLERHKQFRPVLLPAVEGETKVLQCTDYLVEVANGESSVQPT